MSRVWCIEDVNGQYYVGTKKAAERFWGEQPESIGPRDAADECNRLAREIGDLKKELAHVLFVVFEFVGDHPSACRGESGRKLAKLLRGTSHESLLTDLGIV